MCIKILIHFFNAPSISGSLISSNGTSTIPIFLAATAGKTLSRSGVIVKMTDTISSVFILFSEIIVSRISFVGGLYYKNSYDAIEDKLPEYLQGYFDACMEAQLDLYGDNVFDRLLTADILERLCEIIDFHQSDTAFSDIKLVFSSTYLGFKTAQKERIRNLNALASRFEVNLYTDRTDDRLRGVHVRESVDYREEMPLVFHESDINMNFTIRNIRTGLPLRIWDILGAGGFLLTNYQIELGDFFENGKDLVYYDSLDDMMRKAEYYLDHEDERKTIAQNGLKKIVQYHTYEHRIDVILKTVL